MTTHISIQNDEVPSSDRVVVLKVETSDVTGNRLTMLRAGESEHIYLHDTNRVVIEEFVSGKIV